MNLKEAFRYQNKLQALLDEAQGILDCDSNVTNVANTYLRHKVMAEAEDETILDLPQTEYAQQITDIAGSCSICWRRRAACSLPSARQRMRWTWIWTAKSV